MVKRGLLLLCSAVTLYSSDVVIHYKAGGKKFLEQLQQVQNRQPKWSDKLLNKDLRFGYFEQPVTLLACDKSKGSLELYVPDANQRFSLKKRYSAFTGKYNGDKMTEGDLRTPIGVYTLTQKKKSVDPFYGPLAFVTSYPNLYDRARGKNGSGIWIHGVPLSGTRDSFTRGCIAINNPDLVHLDQSIKITNTYLIIDAKAKKPVDRSNYTAILGALDEWKSAWAENRLDEYLSFYSPDFKRFDGLDFRRFKSMKEQIFAQNESKTITFENLSIIPYPGETRNLYMVTFDETYVSDRHTFEGQKSLLVALNSDKSISIITEE